MRHPHPLPQKLLEKLSTPRLLNVLKVARRAELNLWSYGDIPRWKVGFRKQHMENQETFEKRMKEAEQSWNRSKTEIDSYLNLLRSILSQREHVSRNKRSA